MSDQTQNPADRPRYLRLEHAMALLREHCRTGEGGVAIYDEGWDDAKIEEESGLAESTIADIRTKEYGRKRLSRKLTMEDLFDRVEELERRIQKIEADADFREIEDDRPSWNGASHHME